MTIRPASISALIVRSLSTTVGAQSSLGGVEAAAEARTEAALSRPSQEPG